MRVGELSSKAPGVGKRFGTGLRYRGRTVVVRDTSPRRAPTAGWSRQRALVRRRKPFGQALNERRLALRDLIFGERDAALHAPQLLHELDHRAIGFGGDDAAARTEGTRPAPEPEARAHAVAVALLLADVVIQ